MATSGSGGNEPGGRPWTATSTWVPGPAGGAVEDAVSFETSDDDAEASPAGVVLCHPPADSDRDMTPCPCEVTVSFRGKYEIHRVYVRSTARIYELYHSPDPKGASKDYLCTVRCGLAVKEPQPCGEESMSQWTGSASNSDKREHEAKSVSSGSDEDNWVDVKIPESPAGNKTLESQERNAIRTCQENTLAHYEATAEMTDVNPCVSLTIRFLSLQSKASVHIEEIYIFADHVESTSDVSVRGPGNMGGSSLLAMLVPGLMQMSKSRNLKIDDSYFSDGSRNQESSTCKRVTQEAVLCSTNDSKYTSVGIESAMSPTVGVTVSDEKNSQGEFQFKDPDSLPLPVQTLGSTQASSVKDQRELNTGHVGNPLLKENFIPYNHIERKLDTLLSKVEKMELCCSRFENSMIKPLGSIEARLQRLEEQFSSFSMDIQSLRGSSAFRSATDGMSNTMRSQEEAHNDANDNSISTTDRKPGLAVRAPDFMSDDYCGYNVITNGNHVSFRGPSVVPRLLVKATDFIAQPPDTLPRRPTGRRCDVPAHPGGRKPLNTLLDTLRAEKVAGAARPAGHLSIQYARRAVPVSPLPPPARAAPIRCATRPRAQPGCSSTCRALGERASHPRSTRRLEESQAMNAFVRPSRERRSAWNVVSGFVGRDHHPSRGSTMRETPRSRGVLRFLAVGLLGLASAGTALAQGQSATINGRVLTPQGQPLQGANVYIAEMNLSVGTNAAGRYTLTVPGQRVTGQTVQLRVRSIGYKPIAKPVRLAAGTQTVDFQLEEDVSRLSEVVVTGVATGTAARNVPFAVSHVDTTQMPVIGGNAVQQLQGKIAGANIQAASGRPGAAPSVVLRGPTSINASGRGQGPLYIVDGVLLNGNTPDLNPNDIENIEVVKGAAAASLYGARAGGGVINITTKSGRTAAEGIKLGVRTEFGQNDIPHEFAIAKQTAVAMDPSGMYYCAAVRSGGSECARYIDMQAEAKRINDVPTSYALLPQPFMNDFGIAANPARYRLLNLFQATSYPQTYDQVEQATKVDNWLSTNADLRGKVRNTGFFGSVSHATQAGAFKYLNGYTRNSARLNVDQLVGSKLSLQGTSFYATSKEDGANQEGGTGFFRLSRSPAFVNQSLTDAQGRLYIRSDPLNQGSQNANPLYYLQAYNRTDLGTRFLGSIQGRYAALDWLDFNGDFAYDRTTGYTTWLQDRGFRTTDVDQATANGFIQNQSGDSASMNTSIGAAAHPTLVSNLTSTFTAQVLYDAQQGRSQLGYGEGLTVPGLLTLDAASINKDITSGTSQVKSLSYRGGADFEYLDRYILSTSLRREGSSLFGSNQRWSTFPRVAGAWIASAEPWWPVPALSLAKLRAAWGKAGQRPNTTAQYETFSIDRTSGALLAQTLGNPDLRPEILTETELGTDLELFSRYALQVTYAHSVADDQILQVPVPASAGFQTQWRNAGQLTNKTWEASLDIPLLQRNSMRWSTRLIYDRNRAVITRLDVPPYNTTGGVQGSESMFFVRQGERLGTIYGRAFVTECSQLPGNFASQCGGAGSQFQKNGDGFIVWTGGLGLGEGITSNAWNASLNPGSAPWGARAVWGMPMQLRDSVGNPAQIALGNATPDWHGGLSSNFSWGKFAAYGLLDGSFGRKVWNEGYHWALGDFMTATTDQGGKSVADAKPIGYYYRAGPGLGGSSGVGGLYNVLGPTNESVEDASYVKLREMSVNYNVGAVAGQGNWTVGVVGRNLYTWTKYRGYDPEVGRSGGTQLGNSSLVGIDYFTFPNLRTVTLQVSTAF